MARISQGATINAVELVEQSQTPVLPASGRRKVYVKQDGLYIVSASGQIAGPFSGGQETIFTFVVAGLLIVGSSPIRLHAPRACTVDNVTVAVGGAPLGSSVIVDVNRNGETIFTTQGNRPEIAASGLEDLSSVPDVTAIAQNDVITIEVDQTGSTVPGSDLVVQVRCL